MSCPHCADGMGREVAHRSYVLQLLALIEHPTALPAESALRIARDLLKWTEPEHCCVDHASVPMSPVDAAA